MSEGFVYILESVDNWIVHQAIILFCEIVYVYDFMYGLKY
jgi:hypothetical protein